MKVDWRGDALVSKRQSEAKKIALMTAEIVKGEAVDLCPVDTSQTRNSATVTEIDKGAEISFNTPQATWLHESQSYTPSHPGTGPNYLRGPLLAHENQYHEALKKVLQ